MKIRFIALFISLLLFLASCKNSENSAPDLIYQVNLERDISNISSIPLSYLGNKLEYIPLETDSKCLIRQISNISITDSFLFVSDYNRLLLFGRDGKFIRQIGSPGRGPGEYSKVRDFEIDLDNKEVYVLEGRKVLVYDFNGRFIRDFVLGFPSNEFVINENNELVFQPINFAQTTDEQEYSWYFMNKNGKNKSKIPKILKRINGGIAVQTSPLYMYNGILHFMEFGVDTLYSYENHEKKPYAIFNPGILKFPPDPILDEVVKSNGKIWIDNIMETNKFLFVKIYNNVIPLTSKRCVFDKSTSRFAILNDNGFTNDLDDGISFWPQYISDKNVMIDFADAFELIKHLKNKNQLDGKTQSDQLQSILRNLTETSNPVILILKP